MENRLVHIRRCRPVYLLAAVLLLAMLLTAAFPADSGAEVQSRFLYKLANFDGRIPSSWARISIDRYRNEIYLIDTEVVRVFDENGMEIYRFGEDGRLGLVMDLAVLQSGELLVLSRNGSEQAVWICDFRGVPVERLAFRQLPAAYAGFVPDKMVLRNHRLYFANNQTLRVVVTDEDGRFQKGIDLAKRVGIEKNQLAATQIDGFNVDNRGNILFTIPVKFAAHVLSPEGELTSYVKPGGAPGKFNLVSGIASDAEGYYYVADRLKDVVQVFDSEFTFIRQFGYRGSRPDNLFAPRYLAVDSRDRLHISQVMQKGVSVFQLQHEK